ncbi:MULTISPECIES: hypothetical protein [unclassified Haloferax]|uniref:hypothetical protein n=1 Tax=unclassified Haloferax TaxID=2625095 RepID=UPI0028752394|nr:MULTISPECIES: hypothetical protein [unclassified Haloferax]MDS0243940.1 hypothetical protein [Haloferax sp. S2CR25]MDS0447061.1 hypothetical protein [Haloferax sp. S2CR25-2]
MYRRQTSDGDLYEFSADSETLSGYSEHGGANAHADGYSLVFKRRLDDFEGVAFGRGSSENPDRAEAYIWASIENDADTVITDGQFELVVLNSADEVLATIYRRPLDELNKGDPSTDSRGDWGVPFPYQRLRRGRGEIMGDDYQIGVRVKLGSGTESLSQANSSMRAEGYSALKKN